VVCKIKTQYIVSRETIIRFLRCNDYFTRKKANIKDIFLSKIENLENRPINRVKYKESFCMKVGKKMGSKSGKSGLTLLAALSITTLHLFNRYEVNNACRNIPIRTREDRKYEWRFGNIKYKKIGHGSPILLLHDLTIGSSKSEFTYIQKKLSENHTVYIPDILGYGESDKPAMTYTAGTIENFVSDFIKVVIGTKTDIVATGSTAPIAIKVTKANPNFVSNIILINPLGLYDQNLIPSNSIKILKLIWELPILGTYIYNLYSTKTYIENLFKEKYISNVSKMNKQRLLSIVDEYFKSAHIGGYKAKYSHVCFASQYMNVNIIHELKDINNSILIIGGSDEKDIETNIENYKYYNSSIESYIIKETSHLPHIEKPEEVIEQIEVFIS